MVSQGAPRPMEVPSSRYDLFVRHNRKLFGCLGLKVSVAIEEVGPGSAARTDFFRAYERRKNYAHPRYESQSASGANSDASHKRFTSCDLPSLTFKR